MNTWFDFLKVTVIVLVVGWIYKSAKRQKAHIREGKLIFPVARGLRVFGIVGTLFWGFILLLPAFVPVEHEAWLLLIIPFMLGTILFAIGSEVCIDDVQIEKSGSGGRHQFLGNQW